jgi:hypothetical protein
MMGSRVIKGGKLSRTQLACQAGFPREDFRANDCVVSNARTQSPWHVNCEQFCSIERMATKIKMMKLLTEADALAAVDRVPPKPALFLMQMRPRTFQPTLPRRRLSIRIQPEDQAEPTPVPIIFLKPASQA